MMETAAEHGGMKWVEISSVQNYFKFSTGGSKYRAFLDFKICSWEVVNSKPITQSYTITKP